jgi:hypothetical protein
MDHEMQVADADVEELAVTRDALDPFAVQGGGGWIEGLQRREREHVDAIDGATGDPCTEARGEGVDFGELRHGAIIRSGTGIARGVDGDLSISVASR